jgi:hypothetical protein
MKYSAVPGNLYLELWTGALYCPALRTRRERPIIFAIAFCTIAGGIAMAVAADDGREPDGGSTSWPSRRVAGAVFVLGFVLLGVAISHWHPV